VRSDDTAKQALSATQADIGLLIDSNVSDTDSHHNSANSHKQGLPVAKNAESEENAALHTHLQQHAAKG
jgi:hypothetical protein